MDSSDYFIGRISGFICNLFIKTPGKTRKNFTLETEHTFQRGVICDSWNLY